jgi:hypothetical protein
VQRLQVARHPNRPTCLDIILNITGLLSRVHWFLTSSAIWHPQCRCCSKQAQKQRDGAGQGA